MNGTTRSTPLHTKPSCYLYLLTTPKSGKESLRFGSVEAKPVFTVENGDPSRDVYYGFETNAPVANSVLTPHFVRGSAAAEGFNILRGKGVPIVANENVWSQLMDSKASGMGIISVLNQLNEAPALVALRDVLLHLGEIGEKPWGAYSFGDKTVTNGF